MTDTPRPECSDFDFGIALQFLRAGKRVARKGWNGRDMWIALQAGYPDGIAINANTARATGLPINTVCKFLPYIMMKTADGSFVPWLASQTDVLAFDWVVEWPPNASQAEAYRAELKSRREREAADVKAAADALRELAKKAAALLKADEEKAAAKKAARAAAEKKVLDLLASGSLLVPNESIPATGWYVTGLFAHG